jgi:hypothetical protein
MEEVVLMIHVVFLQDVQDKLVFVKDFKHLVAICMNNVISVLHAFKKTNGHIFRCAKPLSQMDSPAILIKIV